MGRWFLNFGKIFSLLSPLGKGHGPSFEQTWFPITQGCFVPSLVEIGSVVLKKKILKVGQCIFAISLLSPLGNGQGPSFEQTWILITEDTLCQVWFKLAQWFSRRRWKCEKFTDRWTDDGQHVIRKARLSFQLGELKKSWRN